MQMILREGQHVIGISITALVRFASLMYMKGKNLSLLEVGPG
jgi:hypothetical protein